MALINGVYKHRPREKLLSTGVASLSNAELLAMILRVGTRGKTALDLALQLLRDYQSLKTLFATPATRLCQIKGIGEAKYAMLQAALELGKRYLEEDFTQGTTLTSPLDAKKYVIAKLSEHKREVFSCLFLNANNTILRYEELFQGTVSCAPVYPRVIAQKALEYNAAALILAHNHPSGSTKPSKNDLEATRNLSTVLSYLDIRILDHLIVGGSHCSSFAESGLL